MGGGISRTPSQKASWLKWVDTMGKDIAATKETAAELQSTDSESQHAARRRWNNIIPALTWLRAYQPQWLRADLIAGITLAAYLMPAGLADASLANLPPEAGLYACLFSGLVYSQHAVAEALWVQRIAWRFLGTLRLLLFALPGNKRGVAPARSLRAGRVTVRETISEEQTRGSVRGDRRDSGGCEHESREARRETAGRSTTGTATIRPSSNTCVRPQRPAAPGTGLFSSWCRRKRRDWSHVCGKARLSFRCEPGTTRYRGRKRHGRTGPRLSC